MRLARTHDADTQVERNSGAILCAMPRNHSDAPPSLLVQRHAAFAIGCLAANARCQRQIGESGGLRPLIKCGYSRSPELQQLVVQAVANLALEPSLNAMLAAEGGHQLLLTLTRSKSPEVVHWAHVAQGNLEAAKMLISAKADVDMKWGELTPFAVALEKGHSRVADALREAGGSL